MRAFLVALLLAWGGGLRAASLIIEPDGRFILPAGDIAIDVHVADAAPVPGPAEKRLLALPGLLVPAKEWRTAAGVSVRLELCLIRQPIGLSEVAFLAVRLRLTNSTPHSQITAFAIALRPVGQIRVLAFERHSFFVADRLVLVADTPSRGAILAASAFAERSLTPQDSAHAVSATGECRGEMHFDLTLAAGATQRLGWLCPLDAAIDFETCQVLAQEIDDLFLASEKLAPATSAAPRGAGD